MLKIAILTGGNVAERSVSLKSAETVRKHLDDQKYEKYVIELNGTQFTDQATGAVRRTDLYDAANGAGSFDAAFALAQQLELEPEPAPRVELLSDEVMDRLLSNDDA